MQETPRRCFSDADRALDPLLCEEDSNPIFRETIGRELTAREQLRNLGGCLGVLLPFGLVYAYARFGPPRLGWLEAVGPAIVGGFVLLWVWGSLRRALAGRVHELEGMDRQGGDRDWDDEEFGGPPYFECGAPAREIVVSRYLLASRGETTHWLLPVVVAVLIGILTVPPAWVAGSGWLAAATVVSAMAAFWSLALNRREQAFANRVNQYLELPGRELAKHLKLTARAPSGMPGPGVPERSWRYLGKFALAVIWGCAYSIFGAVAGLRATGWGPPLYAAGYAASCLAFAWHVRRSREALRTATRARQAAWLDFNVACLPIAHAYEDDPTPDTERWADWMMSPLRDPAAPCPERDVWWVASRGTRGRPPRPH